MIFKLKNKIHLQAGWLSVRPSVRTLIHPACTYLSNQQQLENQTAYAVTNAIVVSS